MTNINRHMELLDSTIDLKIIAEETGGAYSVIEMNVPGHFPGAPMHYHKEMTERFLVLEGELEIEVDGVKHRVKADESVEARRGQKHSYRNPTDQRARFMLVTTPAGHEQFFVELAEWMAKEPVWPPTDRAALAAFGLKHDVYYGG